MKRKESNTERRLRELTEEVRLLRKEIERKPNWSNPYLTVPYIPPELEPHEPWRSPVWCGDKATLSCVKT